MIYWIKWQTREVNQLNRIKLMLATAFKNLESDPASAT